MSEHVDGWIPELVLGTLDAPTRATVEVHLEQCARCAAEVDSMNEAFSALAFSAPPERPHPAARTRLLAALLDEPRPESDQAEREQAGREQAGRSVDRFRAVLDKLARFFDVPIERARALVALIDEPAAWTRGPAEGVVLIHLEAGTRYAGVDAGFVRVSPGATFPHHRHVGGELVLVLQGSFAEQDGTVVVAGESQDLAAGTRHSFTALPEEDCILAVLIWDGLDFAPPAQAD
jgi:putative transcriptional regulator